MWVIIQFLDIKVISPYLLWDNFLVAVSFLPLRHLPHDDDEKVEILSNKHTCN